MSAILQTNKDQMSSDQIDENIEKDNSLKKLLSFIGSSYDKNKHSLKYKDKKLEIDY